MRDTSKRHGGPASKRPIDGAGSAVAVDGPPKKPSGDAAHRHLDAFGVHSPLENRQTDAGLPHRQQALPAESSTNKRTNGLP
jgi:hypothetical protein